MNALRSEAHWEFGVHRLARRKAGETLVEIARS
jgi:hypothetical protein